MRYCLTVVLVCLMAGTCLPAATPPAQPAEATAGAIEGTVKDPSGAVIPDAAIALKNATSLVERTAISDEDGKFSFAGLEPGSYTITVAAKGFAPWMSASETVQAGKTHEVSAIVLQVAPTSGTVEVALSQHDIAAEQLKAEEKQRLNGIFPNFKVSYVPNAAPLSAGQKFQLAWATTFDPATILFTGAIAGYEQGRNNIRAYGQGSAGYAKRFGANYADVLSSEMIGTAALPALLHQDPRYFYKGTGSVLSRALYAIANTVICKGDNGRWQPNYSSVIGNFASGELSNVYYPASSRGAQLTIRNTLLDFGFIAVGNLYQEFVAHELTPSAPRRVATNARLILRDGTPVSLILTDDLTAATTGRGQTVAFALANDIRVAGVTVAKRGSKAFGKLVGGPEIELRIQYVEAGDERVILRASKEPTGATGIRFERPRAGTAPAGASAGVAVPAGTAAIVYVAGDVSLGAAE